MSYVFGSEEFKQAAKKVGFNIKQNGSCEVNEILSALFSMPKDEQHYFLRYQLFLLTQTYYRLVEVVATSPVSFMDYELNHYYDLVVKGIQTLLDTPELKDFPVKFYPVAQNSFSLSEIDAVWDNGIKQEMQDFVGHTQSFLNELILVSSSDSDYLKAATNYLKKTIEKPLLAAQKYSEIAEKAFDTMLEEIKKDIPTKAKKQQVEKITKLTDFITNNCDKTTSIQSKVNRIHEFVKQGEIDFMPKPVNTPKGNKTKLYDEKELRLIWPKLKEKIVSLPNLKD